jgi:hypothetical protein
LPKPKKAAVAETKLQETEDFIVTTSSGQEVQEKPEHKLKSIEELANEKIEQSVRNYDTNQKLYSVILDVKGTVQDPTTDLLNQLAEYPQNDIAKILQINKLIAKYVNMDDIIGKTVEAIKTNVNTGTRVSFPNPEGRNKGKALGRAKELIDDFNKEIKLKRFIRETIPKAYQEATVIMYLRKDDANGWVIDVFPLGVGIIAPYSIGGEPVCLVDMNELKNRLTKAGLKTSKGKDMFFPTVEEEIRSNYAESVYTAYKNKDPYAKLDIRYSKVIRINNNSMRYGLSDIFRALYPAIALQGLYRSDEVNSRARAKKILVQILRKECLGTDFNKNPIPSQAHAHSELIAAYRQSGSAAYTAPATVERVEYVEPKSDLIDIKTIVFHMNRIMSTLGISFLSPESSGQSVSTASISLDQLMKTINSISEQIEEALEKWYAQILIDNGIDASYAPKTKIIDSEILDFKLRKDLATTLYTIFNLSMETSLDLLGIDIEDEVQRRMAENAKNLDTDVFYSRQTAFTSSGNDKPDSKDAGRPKSETPTNKNKYDEVFNKTRPQT